MNSDSNRLKRQIVAELKAEHWPQSLELLEVWCDRFPEDVRAWVNRGYCLLRLDRLDDARSAFDRCLALDPKMEKALTLRAYVDKRLQMHSQPQPDTAEDHFRTVHLEGSQGASSELPSSRTSATNRTGRWRSTRLASQLTFGKRPSSEAERVWREGSVIAGRYDVLEVVQGGMGVVYIAFDRELQRVVAVKTPLPSVLDSEEGRARFHREAEAWIALGIHPNICSALYVQEIGGLPRLFIEYIDGGDLDGILKSDVKLSLGGRLDIAIQIASGLQYTHTFRWNDEDGTERYGLVHRDIKPANILMTLDGIARITDFGLVRSEMGGQTAPAGEQPAIPGLGERVASSDSMSAGSWQTVTEAGGLMGTPPYLAPELWRQIGRASPSSDIYAYGCVLYEIFCGRRPFVVPRSRDSTRAAQLADWIRLHVHEEIPDPLQLVPGLDSELTALMVDCIAKSPDQRPASFAEIRDRMMKIYLRVTGKEYPRPEPQRARLIADSLNNRAVSYVTLGNVARAEQGLRETLRVSPHHLEATYNLCLLEWRSKGLTDAEMVRRLEEARKAHPQPSRGHHLLGRLQLLLDDSRSAVSGLRAALHSGNDSVALRRDFGFALLAAGRAGGDRRVYREAADELAAVVEVAGMGLASLVGRAEALQSIGRDAEAEEVWQEARLQSPDLPGDLDEAVAMLLPGHRARFELRQSNPVQSMLLHPDGRLICRDVLRTAVLWDMAKGQSVGELQFDGGAKRGRSIALAPDGTLLYVCTDGEPVAVWDLRSGRRRRSFRPHPGQVTCVAASPTGRTVVTGGSDRRIRIWDSTTGECALILEGHDAFVSDVAFDDLGETMLSASSDGTVRLWELPQGLSGRVLRGHEGAVNAVAYDPRGELVVSGGEDGTVRVWNVLSGQPRHVLTGHGSAVSDVVVVGKTGLVISGSSDHTVRVWDLEGGAPLRVFRIPQPVTGLDVAVEDARVLVAHGPLVSAFEVPHDLAVRLPFALTEPLAASELEEREQRFHRHLHDARTRIDDGDVEGAVGPLRAARQVDGYEQSPEALELWGTVLAYLPRESLRGCAEIRHFEGHRGQLTGCAFAPDGQQLVSAGGDATVIVWSADDGEERLRFEGHTAPVTGVAVSPNGRLLLSSSRDRTLRLWRLSDGSCLRVLAGQSIELNDVAFVPDGRLAVSAGEDGVLQVWRLDETSPPEILGLHSEPVSSVAVSADGRFVASAGWDEQVIVWSLQTRQELHRFAGHEGKISSVEISPDCRFVASAGADGTIRLWDRAAERCWRVLEGHTGDVLALSFSPDANYLLSGGRDATLRLWDLRTGGCARVVEGHTGPVASLAFSRDGQFALSAGADGTMRQWFLDWEPTLSEHGDWDDRVRPFLEVFLRLRQNALGPGERPTWNDDQFAALLEDLSRRGYGWISTDRLRGELERLSQQWGERRGREQQQIREQAQRQHRRHRVAPLQRLVSGLTRNLGTKLIVAAVAVIAILLLAVGLRSPEPDGARFNDTLYHDVILFYQQRTNHLHKGLVRSYLGKQILVTTANFSVCKRMDYDDYLNRALDPDQYTTQSFDPRVQATSEEFRILYHRAVSCLGEFGETLAVDPILQRVRADLTAIRVEDLLTVLVQIGDPAVPQLAEALKSASEPMRHTAAVALVHIGTEASTEPLVDAISSDNSRAVEAASFVLRELIVSGVLLRSESFPTVRRLARSIDPRVRRNAIQALVLFELEGEARELLDEALDDSDAGVVRAAKQTLESLRTATLEKYLGISTEGR